MSIANIIEPNDYILYCREFNTSEIIAPVVDADVIDAMELFCVNGTFTGEVIAPVIESEIIDVEELFCINGTFTGEIEAPVIDVEDLSCVDATITGTLTYGPMVTATSTLTTNAILKGSDGTRKTESSGILTDSSDNLIYSKPSTTYMYDGTALTFQSKSAGIVAGREYGMYFTVASTIVLSALRFYRLATTDTIRTIRVWDSLGNLLTTGAINTAVDNAWATTGAISYSLTPGNYCLSFTGDAMGIIPGTVTAPTYPSVQNGITQTGAYYNTSGTQFPATTMGVTYLLGVDMVWATTYNLTISKPASMTTSSKTITYPDATGTVALTSNLTNYVQSSTVSPKFDALEVSSTGVLTTDAPSVFTGAVWSPTGTLNITVASGYYNSVPKSTANMTNPSNPGGNYTMMYDKTNSTVTNLRYYGMGNAGVGNLNCSMMILGK